MPYQDKPSPSMGTMGEASCDCVAKGGDCDDVDADVDEAAAGPGGAGGAGSGSAWAWHGRTMGSCTLKVSEVKKKN